MMDSVVPPNGAEAFFLEHLVEIEDAIKSVCRRRRVCGEDAKDLESKVKLKLIDHDYAVLRTFQGRCRLYSWVAVVALSVYIDDLYTRYVKPRPSAQALKDGPISVLLERLIVRDGFTFDEAYEIIHTNYQIDITRQQLYERWKALPVREPRQIVPDHVLPSLPAPDRLPDELAIDDEREVASERLFAALGEEVLALESEKARLMLTSIYEDGLSVQAVGRLLGCDKKETKRLYDELSDLLRLLRKRLEDRKFDANLVREVLDLDRLY